MYADICEATDVAKWERFKTALNEVGAVLIGQYPEAVGVILLQYRIDGEQLNVFLDNWQVDVEGSETVVNKVLSKYSIG